MAPSRPSLSHASFNQDVSCLALADSTGFRILRLGSHGFVYSKAAGAIRCFSWEFTDDAANSWHLWGLIPLNAALAGLQRCCSAQALLPLLEQVSLVASWSLQALSPDVAPGDKTG